MLGYFELDSNLAAHPNRETHFQHFRNDFFCWYSYFLLTMYNNDKKPFIHKATKKSLSPVVVSKKT